MWKDYASNGNGICIEFSVGNYDYLYPAEYLDKGSIDFNKMIISGINNGDFAFAIIPWVIKNPYNITLNMDSTKEKEVRMLYCPYDLGEVNGGTVEMDIKERLGYKGIEIVPECKWDRLYIFIKVRRQINVVVKTPNSYYVSWLQLATFCSVLLFLRNS
ncbi:MAG: hypothetical protein HFH68_17605 [Lachnospiraceae bacterium]|nr:hypothetical protein [Lachnospiraceae bacterium]